MSNKPAYLGLLGAIAIGEGRAHIYLRAWAEKIDDPDVRRVIETVAIREGEHALAQRIPAWLLRGMGRLGDLAQSFGRNVQLTREAADILTRSVPVDDGLARKLLATEAISEEASFRDLLLWMHSQGLVDAQQIGDLRKGESI
jgi:hypothetical protein